MDKQKVMENSLDMDELDQVSGGSTDECRSDMGLFFGGGIQTFDGPWIPGSGPKNITAADLKKLEAAFAQYGVVVKARLDRRQGEGGALFNRYYINGEKVSRADAWMHILDSDPGRFVKVFANPENYPFRPDDA